MTRGEGLITKLLREKKITEEQAIILLRINTSNDKELVIEENIPKEYPREFNVYEDCRACSPKYGGSGICGCVLSAPKITC
jgi:hypothetical protein